MDVPLDRIREAITAVAREIDDAIVLGAVRDARQDFASYIAAVEEYVEQYDR